MPNVCTSNSKKLHLGWNFQNFPKITGLRNIYELLLLLVTQPGNYFINKSELNVMLASREIVKCRIDAKIYKYVFILTLTTFMVVKN